MADKFVALRVPIALLHRRVFNTSHRLDPWEGVIDAADKEPPVKDWQKRSFGTGLVTVNGKLVYDRFRNLFDVTPHARKYWVLIDGIQRTACRGCGQLCVDDEERRNHLTCHREIHLVCKAIEEEGLCCICEKPMNTIKIITDFNGCPVCCDDCCEIWDSMLPQSYTEMYARMKQQGKFK